MVIADFKQLVIDYMNRDAAVFDVGVGGKTDKVLQAANNAKAYAQRLIKFEAAKTLAKLSVTQADGGALSAAKLVSDDSSVRIRSIEHALCPTVEGAYYPLDLISRDVQLEQIKTSFPYSSTRTDPERSALRPQVVRDGLVLRLEPWPYDVASPVTIQLRIVQWMPEYSALVTEDFFLLECRDWMLYRCIQELNFLLKEDQRTVIAAQVMKDAWESMKAWNAEFAGTSSDLSLD